MNCKIMIRGDESMSVRQRVRRLGGWTLLVCGLLAGPADLRAGDADDQAIQRRLAFVEQATDATARMSAGQYEEALAVFTRLQECCEDLDENAHVAVSLGECLARLGRDDQAREVWTRALARHPEAAEGIQRRLQELELHGPVDDTLVERLRSESAAGGEASADAAFRLGRALQRRAKDLLVEAGAAFRAAAKKDLYLRFPSPDLIERHAGLVEAIAEDLTLLIRQSEGDWDFTRMVAMGGRCGTGGAAGRSAQSGRLEWRIHRPDGSQVAVVEESGAQGTCLTVDGRVLELDARHRELIERHLRRIDEILLEAADGTDRDSRARP